MLRPTTATRIRRTTADGGPGRGSLAAMSNAAGPPPPTRSIPISEPQKWRAFWVCAAVAGITILDLSKINVALPSIEAALGSSATALQLLVAGYVLTFGLVLVPMGRIGDQRSRRMLFLIGLTLFTIMSFVCATATSTEVLLVGRLLQGAAAGIQMPQVVGLTQELFRGRERGRAFGLFGAVIGVSASLGPTIGGLLIAVGGTEDGWRWTFWMNLPLCLIAIALAAWMLPNTRHPSQHKLALDPVGVVLFGLTVLSLMWPFLFTTGSPDDDPLRWWVLVLFVLFAAAFVWWERRYEARGNQPLVPLRLFRIGSFRNGTLLMTVYFTAVPPMFLLTNLFLQTGLGFAPLYAGLVTVGFALGSSVTSWIGGLIVNRYGRQVVVWGLLTVLAAVLGMTATALYVPVAHVGWVMALLILLGGIGGGLVISPNQTLTLMEIPVSQGGLAGSMGQLGQRIGTAIGTAVALSLFFSTVYREEGQESNFVVYQDAYTLGMLAVALFVALAFVVAVVDLTARRRQRPSGEVTGTP